MTLKYKPMSQPVTLVLLAVVMLGFGLSSEVLSKTHANTTEAQAVPTAFQKAQLATQQTSKKLPSLETNFRLQW